MSLYPNSGVPEIHNVSGSSTDPVQFKGETLSVYVGGEGTKVYFNKADFDAGKNFVTVGPSGFYVWARVTGLFVQGAGNVEVIGFMPGR